MRKVNFWFARYLLLVSILWAAVSPIAAYGIDCLFLADSHYDFFRSLSSQIVDVPASVNGKNLLVRTLFHAPQPGGRMLVFLPELDGSILTYEQALLHMPEKSRGDGILVVELKGQGITGQRATPIEESEVEISEQASLLNQVFVHFGISGGFVHGYSYSSAVASAFAKYFPAKVQGLTLIAPYAGPIRSMPKNNLSRIYEKLVEKGRLDSTFQHPMPGAQAKNFVAMLLGLYKVNMAQTLKDVRAHSIHINMLLGSNDSLISTQDQVALSDPQDTIAYVPVDHKVMQLAPQSALENLLTFLDRPKSPAATTPASAPAPVIYPK